MSQTAPFEDMFSMMVALAWAPFNYAMGLQAQVADAKPQVVAPKPEVVAPVKTAWSKPAATSQAKSDEFAVVATRSILLRATSSLTQVSTACHDYCERLSNAFTALRFMEAMSSVMRPFMPFGNTSAFGAQSWFPALSMPAPAPHPYWAAMSAPVNNAIMSTASPLLAIAPKREIESGIAMGMAIFFVTANTLQFAKV